MRSWVSVAVSLLAAAACAEGGTVGTGGADTTGAGNAGPSGPSTGTESASGGTGPGGTTSTGCTQETCNLKDDDCNGTIDDPSVLNGLPCDTGSPGACAAGTTLCQTGVNTCVPNIEPGTQPEICNSQDDDCNNMVDDLDANDACPTQFPQAINVDVWSCGTGTCAIMACAPATTNYNGTVDDGCECATDSNATMCSASATTNVALGGSVSMTGVIDAAGVSDWLTFQFEVPPIGAAYHPRIELTNNGNGAYMTDMMINCTSTTTCATAGFPDDETGLAATVWEQNYNAYIPGPSCCTDNTPRASTVVVRVYRVTPPACDTYTVTATNQ